MAKTPIEIPVLYVADPTKAGVIALGNVYIGEPDLDGEIEANRKTVTVLQEDGSEVPIQPEQQPLNTGAGGILLYQGVPVTVLVDGEYSIKVTNQFGGEVYYIPSVNEGTSVSLTGGKIDNGSFESVTGTEPDSWTIERTGTGVIESSIDSGDGLASVIFTSIDGLGAGRILSTPFDVNSNEGADVGFMLKSTGIDTRNTVDMQWLDDAGNVLSTVTVADITGDSPIDWDTFDLRTPNAPANAVQGVLILYGMNAGGAAMIGSSLFDGVRINDNSVNLGNGITEDSANTLRNKIIEDGEYTGTQTGFVGDVEGQATTVEHLEMTGDVEAADKVSTIGDDKVLNKHLKSPAVGSFIVKHVYGISNPLTVVTTALPANLDHYKDAAQNLLIGTALVTGTIRLKYTYYMQAGSGVGSVRVNKNGVQVDLESSGTNTPLVITVDIPVTIGDVITLQYGCALSGSTQIYVYNVSVFSDSLDMAIA